MNNRRFLLAGFLGLAGLAVAAQDATPLQRTLVENSVDTYKITSKVNQTIQSPQFGDLPLNITSGLTYKLKTGKVDAAKGSADVQVTTTVDTFDPGDSPLASALGGKKPEPIVQTGTMDRRGRMQLQAPTAGDPAITMMMGATGSMQAALFIELPDHAVKVGDSWDIVIPKGPFTGDTDQKITAKLTGDQKLEGHDAWTVDLSGTVNIRFDSSKVAAAPAGGAPNPFANIHIIVRGSTTMKGTGLVEKSTGKTLSLTTNGDMKSSMEMPDQGNMTADSAGTVSTTVKLQN